MEFGATAATFSKKLSNGYGVSGRSAYDGVFAAPIKLRAPSFPSKFEGYCEIFGGSEASLGSSIPILELPELNERKTLDDVGRSKLDYLKVFGGFGNLDTAMPFEELFAEPKQKDSFPKEASARSKAKGGNQSCTEDPTSYSKEVPLVSQEALSSNDAKRINMSYHKVNQGSENGTNGTTHIAQLHAIPAYTCLVEEVNPGKMKGAHKSMPVAQDAYSVSHCNKGTKEGRCRTKSFTGPSTDAAEKQSSNCGFKVHNRSDSINLLFDACEISNGSNGTHHIKVPTSETVLGNFDNHNDDAMRSMATKCEASKSRTSEGAANADSPAFSDDIVDSNSEAAASLAALRKAIEEAQVRMKIAKESMKRKKEGFSDRVKWKSSLDLKGKGEKQAKLFYETMKHEEINMRETFGEMDALPQVPSGKVQPTMRLDHVRSDIRANEMFVAKGAAREAQKKLKSTLTEHKEVELKEADHKANVIELKEPDNNKKVSHIKNTGWNAFKKPAESDQTTEVVKGDSEWKNIEEEIRAHNEAGGCEELLDEIKQRSKERVNEIKLVQETLDSKATDKRLKMNDDGDLENKFKPFYDPGDCERKKDGQELTTGNEKQVACKAEEDGKRVEGSFEMEEYQRNLRDLQELREVEKDIPQEQKGIYENVEVSSEMEECELTEFLGPIDNEPMFNLHDADLNSMEEKVESLQFVEDGKRRNEPQFIDINRGMEHYCQREDAENVFKSTCMQDILEDIVDPLHGEKEIYERITEVSELDRIERVQDAKESENELEGGTHRMEDNEMESKDNKEPVEVIRVTQNGPNNGEMDNGKIEAKEAGYNMETISSSEPGGIEELSNTKVDDTILGNDENLKVILEVYAHDVQDDILVAGDASLQPQESEEPETVQERNDEPEIVQERYDFQVKQAVESSASTLGACEHNEASNQIQNTSETVICKGAAINMVAGDASLQRQEKYEESETVQERNEEPEAVRKTNDFQEKHAVETSAFTLGAYELNQALNQMQNTSETVTCKVAATRIGETDIKVTQYRDQCLEMAENDLNLAKLVEDPTPESLEISNDAKKAETAINEEVHEYQSNSSDDESLFDNEHNVEESQIPSRSEWKSCSFKKVGVETIHSNLKENHHAPLTVEEKEKEGSHTSQKLELEKEHLKKIDEVKEREREREKEKLAVERAIREARERAFAEARERAATERAAAEARQKNISDGRERLGKTNEKRPAEKAAMEAKLKAERAAVERATAEARSRALERALSEKAAFDSRNKSDKSVAEKCFGASRDNGMKQSSKSFSYGDIYHGDIGDSAERCKARSERHQRIGERVAKALAEKNMRDHLAQKEQEERNRVAEVLDADVKRWSSGKAGNLRALLSTLQYILGPDSGWQPIPLTDIVTTTAVKKAYRKATLFVHPDKLQQRGASIQQKYTCEKVFDLLKEAWNRFNMEER